MSAFLYNIAAERLMNGEYNMTHTFKGVLLEDSYVPDLESDQDLADVIAHEASGPGYEACDVLLTLTRTDGVLKVEGADAEFTNVTTEGRFLVVYDDDHADDGLLCYFDFGTTATVIEGDIIYRFHQDGMLVHTVNA